MLRKTLAVVCLFVTGRSILYSYTCPTVSPRQNYIVCFDSEVFLFLLISAMFLLFIPEDCFYTLPLSFISVDLLFPTYS